MSKVKKAIKIVVTNEQNKQQTFGEFEGLSSLSSHCFDREHQEFLVASEMNKIFTKQKERIIRSNQIKMEIAKTENQELRAKLMRIRDKAESAFRGDYIIDNYRRVVQQIFNEVRELEERQSSIASASE